MEVKERELMSEEEFKEYLKETRNGLMTFEAVRQVKSVKRAIKRGRVTPQGVLMPRRPYNNRANTSMRSNTHSRVNNQLKRGIYEHIVRGYN